MEKIFVIVTGDKYPDENAGAVRTHSFAKVFSELGFSPCVIGMGRSTSFQWSEYDGISYCSLRYDRKNRVSRILGRALFGHNLKKVLNSSELSEIGGILYVSGGIIALRYVKRLSRRYAIPLYFDSVEWYSPSEFKMGKMSPAYVANNRLNTHSVDRKFRVFAISAFLEEHFRSRGIPTIRIPVIMDVQKMPFREANDESTESEKIRMIYAGSPGRKDRLCEMVEAIGLLSPEERRRIEFHIVGLTSDGYAKIYGEVPPSELAESIVFEGRKPRHEVIRQVADSDFAFLLRPPEERYAKAGFPTKAVESLSVGTPMLCNFSSDLSAYLKGGENSVIIDNCTADACYQALKRILGLSREQMNRMRAEARRTAEENFDWRKYTSAVEKFMLKM